MLNKTLITQVDELVEIVKKKPQISVTQLQNHFHIPLSVLEKWLIVLEEFDVLKIKYRGLEGYVSLSKTEIEKLRKNELDIDKIKEKFKELAKKKNWTYDKILKVWPIFLQTYEEKIKEEFLKKAKKQGYDLKKSQMAWTKFRKSLEEF